MTSGAVVFVTGLPSSGKSTFAEALRLALRERAVAACTLDGDAVRENLVPKPGYLPEERERFYESLGNLAALLARQGLIVMIAATANRAEYRAYAQKAAPRYVEVLVDVPIDECRARDAKGLYAAYRRGELSEVPGEDAAYERPMAPHVVAKGGHDAAAIRALVELLAPE